VVNRSRSSRRREGESPGVLRIHFPKQGSEEQEKFDELSCDEFFDKFDCAHLAMVYEEKTADGEKSRFARLSIAPRKTNKAPPAPSDKSQMAISGLRRLNPRGCPPPGIQGRRALTL
jgi:hypothetical protein